MYDLTFIIPLYGENCWKVSARMNTTLACLKTSRKVRVMYVFDHTVSYECVMNIDKLFKDLGSNIHFTIIPVDSPRSGYKRNIAIEKASNDSKYVWLLDQDDWLIIDNIDAVLNAADGIITEQQPAIKINFIYPSNIHFSTNIGDVITMPWQYITLSSILKEYKFDEGIEMGSDIPVFPELIKKYFSDKPLPQIVTPVYFYNYVNENSESYKFFVKGNNQIADQKAIDRLKEEAKKQKN